MYVELDRNTENGVEIQNSACRRSKIVMQLIIFKSTVNEVDQEDDEDNLPHGTKVLNKLVMS